MTSNGPAFTARILGSERMNSSRNGNPRYRIAFDNGQFCSTEVDGSVGYEVPNYTHSRYRSTEFQVWTTRRGNVTRLEPVTEP